MALENFIFRVSALELNPSFKTTKITSCSGPLFTVATPTAAVSKMHSSAPSQMRSISTELVCVSETEIAELKASTRMPK